MSVRIATVAQFAIDIYGRVISKSSPTEPLLSLLDCSYELRIVENWRNPNTLGNPTVKEYIEREAADDYIVFDMGPNSVTTVAADTSSSYTLFLESNKETWTVSVAALTSPVLTWNFSDGTTADQIMNGAQINHTFDPHDPPNSMSMFFPAATPIIEFNAINSEAITIQLPPLSSNPASLILSNLVGLTSFTTYAAWDRLEIFQMSNTSVGSLVTYPEWTKLNRLFVFNSPIGAFTLHPEWILMGQVRAENCGWVGSCSVPNTWTSLEIFRIFNNPGLTALTVPNTLIALKDLQFASCALSTSVTTHPEWVDLEILSCGNNPSLGGITTYPQWTNMTLLSAYRCGLTVNPIHATWTAIENVQIYRNDLSIAEIDAMLIALDACGTSNGVLNYIQNPGSNDGDRSVAAATAKANLIARGWAVQPA